MTRLPGMDTQTHPTPIAARIAARERADVLAGDSLADGHWSPVVAARHALAAGDSLVGAIARGTVRGDVALDRMTDDWLVTAEASRLIDAGRPRIDPAASLAADGIALGLPITRQPAQVIRHAPTGAPDELDVCPVVSRHSQIGDEIGAAPDLAAMLARDLSADITDDHDDAIDDRLTVLIHRRRQVQSRWPARLTLGRAPQLRASERPHRQTHDVTAPWIDGSRVWIGHRLLPRGPLASAARKAKRGRAATQAGMPAAVRTAIGRAVTAAVETQRPSHFEHEIAGRTRHVYVTPCRTMGRPGARIRIMTDGADDVTSTVTVWSTITAARIAKALA